MAKQKRTDAERRARQCERIGRVLRVLQLVLSKGSPWDAKAIATELEVDVPRDGTRREIVTSRDFVELRERALEAIE